MIQELSKPTGAVTLGQGTPQYMDGRAMHCTLIVTEECNLRCTYCYERGKNSNHPMTLETGKAAIDFVLFRVPPKEAIVLEFTGGECSLKVDLMRALIEYFKMRLADCPGHPYQSSYVIMLCTNGVLYHTKNFQRLLWENRQHVYPSITIDGTKMKHDQARVFPDGSGSYDIVARNVKLWLRQFPLASTKMTFTSSDISQVCDSVLHVWKLGIRDVASNVVFEDVWHPGDPETFEAQLRNLADIAIAEGFCDCHDCSFFWVPREASGLPPDDRNWCGTGKMISVDAEGDIFPCVRFQRFCLNNKPGRCIGNVYDGFNRDMIRSFQCLRKSLQSPAECLSCTMQDQCAWCTAVNYDYADSDTIFQRATFICEMHKARWRANQYYWAQLRESGRVHPGGRSGGRYVCPA